MMFKWDQAAFISKNCGNSNRCYTQACRGYRITRHIQVSRKPHVATFHEEDTKPWTKHTNTRVRTPVQDPPSGLITTRVSGYDPVTYIHVEWGTTRFKYLGQPSYRAYWFHMSAYDQFVQRLIKVKHTIFPYSFFGSQDRVRTPLLLSTQRPSYLPTIVWFYQVNLHVISGPLVAFSVDFF